MNTSVLPYQLSISLAWQAERNSHVLILFLGSTSLVRRVALDDTTLWHLILAAKVFTLCLRRRGLHRNNLTFFFGFLQLDPPEVVTWPSGRSARMDMPRCHNSDLLPYLISEWTGPISHQFARQVQHPGTESRRGTGYGWSFDNATYCL